jgi:hypothetical protein
MKLNHLDFKSLARLPESFKNDRNHSIDPTKNTDFGTFLKALVWKRLAYIMYIWYR